jgi:LuxR family transcriptional regulator, maltose regulon positive regulatory protein
VSTGVPLLTSKAAVPVLPDSVVPRRRLVDLLDAGVRAPLTVLSAPAGWDKTAALNATAEGVTAGRADGEKQGDAH